MNITSSKGVPPVAVAEITSKQYRSLLSATKAINHLEAEWGPQPQGWFIHGPDLPKSKAIWLVYRFPLSFEEVREIIGACGSHYLHRHGEFADWPEEVEA